MRFNCKCDIHDDIDRFWYFFRINRNQVSTIIIFVLMLSDVSNTLAENTMKLSENDSGKTVEIVIGDDLQVILPANPTTGYIWEVNSIDSHTLQANKADFVANNPAIGTGGLEIIQFHALTTGKSELKLILHRPFEQNTPPLKTFAVTVIIKK